MIAKCIVVLAIVAQINGQVCVGNGVGTSSIGTTRNIVARGKYPVALQNSGPCIDRRVPVSASHVQTPVQVKPTVRLPACIPPQRTVSHTCTCYKTVMRPTVHEQLITVPSIQRYIETTHKPVIENIHYEGCPVNGNNFGYSENFNGYSGVYGGGFGGYGNGASLATPVGVVAPVTVVAPVATYSVRGGIGGCGC